MFLGIITQIFSEAQISYDYSSTQIELALVRLVDLTWVFVNRDRPSLKMV